MSCLPFTVKDPSQRLVILIIVGRGEYIEPLRLALASVNEKEYGNKILLSLCEDIDEILSCSPDNVIVPDYIVYVLDPENNSCLQIAEENIRKTDSCYISAGKLCFVNGSCNSKPTKINVGPGYINILSQKYSALLINGDVLVPQKCVNLASRILITATSVCGYNTGIPITLDIPGCT